MGNILGLDLRNKYDTSRWPMSGERRVTIVLRRLKALSVPRLWRTGLILTEPGRAIRTPRGSDDPKWDEVDSLRVPVAAMARPIYSGQNYAPAK